MTPANLADVPAYSQMYECWVAVQSNAVDKPDQYKAEVYHYETDPTARTSTIHLPSGDPISPRATPPTMPPAGNRRFPNSANSGYGSDRPKGLCTIADGHDDAFPEYTEILNASGRSLQRTTSIWEAGDAQGYPRYRREAPTIRA